MKKLILLFTLSVLVGNIYALSITARNYAAEESFFCSSSSVELSTNTLLTTSRNFLSKRRAQVVGWSASCKMFSFFPRVSMSWELYFKTVVSSKVTTLTHLFFDNFLFQPQAESEDLNDLGLGRYNKSIATCGTMFSGAPLPIFHSCLFLLRLIR